MDYKDIKPGKIYNKVYTGNNEAYKRINGKSTILIIENDGSQIIASDLFARFPRSPFDPQLKDSKTFYQIMFDPFREYELTEVRNKKDFFIHSQTMGVKEALDKGLVTIDELKYIFRDQSKNYVRQIPVTSVWRADGTTGCYITILCEGKSKENPYLQSVILVWDSFKEAEKELSKFIDKPYLRF